MNLKEAFRYQNYLHGLIRQTLAYLGDTRVTMKTTQEHLRKKANPNAENEKIDMSAERPIEYDANTLIDFLEYLLDTKESLTNAIAKAKVSSPYDIDGSVANNKMRQQAAAVLSRMCGIRPTDRVRYGTDYTFNAEGNQTQYNYEIKEVSVIDFDRAKVKAIAKRLVTESDVVSTLLDRMLVETEVEYDPRFSVNDTYEDALETFAPKT